MERTSHDELQALRQELFELRQTNTALHNELDEYKSREAQLFHEHEILSQRITEHINKFHAASAELAQAIQSRDDFLAMISHELRTPLNTVLGITEMLQDEIYGTLNARQQKALGSVEASGRHLLVLINDILDLSTIEAGTLKLYYGPVDVERICQDSLHSIRERARTKTINLSFKMDYTTTIIQADATRLKQILVNLLSNAIKFTEEGGQAGLDVLVDEERDIISFSIWDSGVGIPPEQMSRLFKPFVQLDSGLDRQYEGTGLGLVLVARLTELHGGSVSVESEPGKGSRFTILLPYGNDAQSDYAEGKPPQPPAHLPLILVADDNEVTIQLLTDYLTFKGYRVAVARNGVEATEQAHKQQPDLILMDIQMPVMNGMEAMRLIRTDMHLLDVPIIALTSLDIPGHREDCFLVGANDYMSKPVSLRDLIKSIEKLV